MNTVRTLTRMMLGAACVTAIIAAPSQAMTGNASFDGDAHPAVVALLVINEPGVASMFCSGTLISPTVVVTASHCASYAADSLTAARTLVSNDPILTNDPGGSISIAALQHVSAVSSIAVNPKYKPGYGTDSYREDVSAIVISNPTALARLGGVPYPALPNPGVLDQLQSAGQLRSLPIQVMGYGTEAATNGAGGHTFADTNERRVADLTIAALNQQVIRESQKQSKGAAGACYGDSGGPTFATINGTWTILGVTSTGDIPCWSTNTASRIDRLTVRAFLATI